MCVLLILPTVIDPLPSWGAVSQGGYDFGIRETKLGKRCDFSESVKALGGLSEVV